MITFPVAGPSPLTSHDTPWSERLSPVRTMIMFALSEREGNPKVTTNSNENGSGENQGTVTNTGQGQQQQSAPTQQQSAPVPPVTPPAQPVQSQQNAPNFGEVMTSLNAMPEKIVNAIREATQPAKPPVQSQSNAGTGDSGNGAQNASQGSGNGNGASSATPQKKSFSDWWFGS